MIGRAASSSYVPREPDSFEGLRALLVALWERERDPRGMVTMRYATEVFTAARR